MALRDASRDNCRPHLRRTCRLHPLPAQAGDGVGKLMRRDVDAHVKQRRDDLGAWAPLSHGCLDLRQQRRYAASPRRRMLDCAAFEAGPERVRRHQAARQGERQWAQRGSFEVIVRIFWGLYVQNVQYKCVPRHYMRLICVNSAYKVSSCQHEWPSCATERTFGALYANFGGASGTSGVAARMKCVRAAYLVVCRWCPCADLADKK